MVGKNCALTVGFQSVLFRCIWIKKSFNAKLIFFVKSKNSGPVRIFSFLLIFKLHWNIFVRSMRRTKVHKAAYLLPTLYLLFIVVCLFLVFKIVPIFEILVVFKDFGRFWRFLRFQAILRLWSFLRFARFRYFWSVFRFRRFWDFGHAAHAPNIFSQNLW